MFIQHIDRISGSDPERFCHTERFFSNARNGFRDRNICEFITLYKRILSNIRYIVRDGDSGELAASLKGSVSNAFKGFRERNAAQFGTFAENVILKQSDTIRDSKRFEA